MEDDALREEPRVPVVFVTGYAGAGKTHTTNRLLRACERLGIVVGVIAHYQAEEFGITPHPIDASLAMCVEPIYDFGSGCVCCSPGGELTRLLGTLPSTLDLLILKLGPLASPLVFAKAVVGSARFTVASIVAIVDPFLAPRHLAQDSPEWQARAQVRCADLVLLNAKGAAPAVEDGGATTVMREASTLVAGCMDTVEAAPVETLPAGIAALERLVLSRRAFSSARAAAIDPNFQGPSEMAPRVISLTAHDRRLTASCAVESGRLYAHKFRELCLRLAASGTVLRLKGSIWLHAAPRDGAAECDERDGGWMSADGVEEQIEFAQRTAPTTVSDEVHDRASKLYVLGRALAVGSLRRDLQACRVPEGYEFAADVELHFGRPVLTAASTAVSGVGPHAPQLVFSDIPRVLVARLRLPAKGASGEEFIAIEAPSGVLELEDARIACNEPEDVDGQGSPGLSLWIAQRCYPLISSSGLADAQSSPSPDPSQLPAQTCAPIEPQISLRLLPMVRIDDSLYVRVHWRT